MADTEKRIAELERTIGQRLPAEYRLFLLTHVEEPDRPLLVVMTNPDHWDVSSLFELGSGANYLQVDNVFNLVADVLPVGLIPIADDNGGNLYLLDARAGEGGGRVYWWDHEQDPGESRVQEVANDFGSFLGLLVADKAD